MTNKEQIQRDIAIAFDFVEQIIDNPDILDKLHLMVLRLLFLTMKM